MAELVSSIRIPDLVLKLREGEYLVPRFQREFVWVTADVIGLLSSIIDSRPIGMMTLWEQPDDSGLDLEHVSLPDRNGEENDEGIAYFGDNSARTNKAFAILDGRQRSTAIAMAFGGLKSIDERRRHAGKFYLNVLSTDPVDRIVFKKLADIKNGKLDILANAISSGLFPFEMDFTSFDDLDKQWMQYIKSVSDPSYYLDGTLPDKQEIDRRTDILENAFKGIINTTLAVYSVPKKYDLGTICEIFETLNTTGTKVSTVDLIHSWLYSDTREESPGPLLLREWIRELGQKDGAIGWADVDHRPELIAQFVTATYLAEREPSEPRKVGGKTRPVLSVKSGDLLSTPTSHWKDVAAKADEFASYIGDFQHCVARNRFPMEACPYPISAAIYVGLRWTNRVDSRGWTTDIIDSLYRAFFWRNALRGRYDQGFLTKMSADLKTLMSLLDAYDSAPNFGTWASNCCTRLDSEVGEVVSIATLIDQLLESKPAGALGKALTLPVLTNPN
ncbi:MAG: DUF262 domain-containing protein [Caulobacteraceae bacterium]